MHYIKDTGYVIRRFNVSEADKYITILTQNHGKIDVLAKGIRKSSSKRASQIELLNKISFQAVSKNQNARYVLADTTLLRSHSTLKHTLEHMRVLFTMCELVSVLCPHNQRQEDIFRLIDFTLEELNSKHWAEVLSSFQIKLLSALGYWDSQRVFVDAQDIDSFTEQVMERKIRSSEFFRS